MPGDAQGTRCRAAQELATAPRAAVVAPAQTPGAVALAAPQAAGSKDEAAAAVDPAERKAKVEKSKADDERAKADDEKVKGEPKTTAAKEPSEPRAAVPEPKAAKDEPKLEAPKPVAKKGDDLDALLNIGAAAKKEDKAAADAEENLPEALSQDQIKSGMGGVKGKVQGCFDKYQVAGLAKVSVTIGKSGKVSSANVTGEFAGTETGSCVATAVKSASFPRFKGKPLSISYTFLLR